MTSSTEGIFPTALAFGFFDQGRIQRVRRNRACRVTGVDTGLFDVLHHAADSDFFAVGDGIDVHFYGVIQEATTLAYDWETKSTKS